MGISYWNAIAYDECVKGYEDLCCQRKAAVLNHSSKAVLPGNKLV